MPQIKKLFNIFFYIFLAWLCYLTTVILHEWAHGTMAWCFGYKSNPFAIDYGGWGWQNLLYLAHVDEAVHYILIGKLGHPYQAALIAITPPLLVNGTIAVGASYALTTHRFNNRMALWLTFWFFIWSLGECFSYFIQRCFSNHGDVSGFLYFTQLSPWVIFVPATYGVFYLMHRTFKNILPNLLIHLNIKNKVAKSFMFTLVIAVLFLFYTLRGLNPNNNEITQCLSLLSIVIAPIFFRIYFKDYWR